MLNLLKRIEHLAADALSESQLLLILEMILLSQLTHSLTYRILHLEQMADSNT